MDQQIDLSISLQQTNTHTHPNYQQKQQQFTKKHSKEIPNKPTTSIEQKFNKPFFSLPHSLSISTHKHLNASKEVYPIAPNCDTTTTNTWIYHLPIISLSLSPTHP
jgi:hypothetical protein